MNRLRERWAAASPRKRLGVASVAAAGLVAIVAIGLAGGLGLLTPQPTPPLPSPTLPPPTPLPTLPPTPPPTPSPSPSEGPDPLLGADGRLTVLLLGSDARPSHPGNRTDAMMVVSVDGTDGQTAVVSIPRDTVRFPLPDGTVYAPKVNALYQHYIGELGREAAGAEMKRTVGAALGVEVDWYVVIGFEGVRRLVDAVGGVDVTLERAVRDPFYWVTSRSRGVFFPAGVNHLDGDRALIFVRTRQGDNDYERARRQQLFVAAAVAEVRDADLATLVRLVEVSRDRVRTDLPLGELAALHRIVAMADLETERRAVLGPRTYADGVPGSASIVLKLDVVRALVGAWMAPAEGSLRSSPSPLPSPSPAPGVATPAASP